jgi:hypothetical protein
MSQPIDPEIAAQDAEMAEAMENPKSVTVFKYPFSNPSFDRFAPMEVIINPIGLSDYEPEPTVIDFKFPENTQETESKPNPRKRKTEDTKHVLYPRKKPKLTREVRDLLLNSINNQPRLIPFHLSQWETKYGPNAVLLLNKGHC